MLLFVQHAFRAERGGCWREKKVSAPGAEASPLNNFIRGGRGSLFGEKMTSAANAEAVGGKRRAPRQARRASVGKDSVRAGRGWFPDSMMASALGAEVIKPQKLGPRRARKPFWEKSRSYRVRGRKVRPGVDHS